MPVFLEAGDGVRILEALEFSPLNERPDSRCFTFSCFMACRDARSLRGGRRRRNCQGNCWNILSCSVFFRAGMPVSVKATGDASSRERANLWTTYSLLAFLATLPIARPDCCRVRERLGTSPNQGFRLPRVGSAVLGFELTRVRNMRNLRRQTAGRRLFSASERRARSLATEPIVAFATFSCNVAASR